MKENIETLQGRSTQESEYGKQFKDITMLHLDGVPIGIHEISPETQKTEVPVVFAPGWAATPKIYKSNLVALAEAGRKVIAVDAPHGISTPEAENYAAAELRKAAAILKALEAKGVERVDVIGHSEGAIYLLMIARMYPEKIRNMVLIDPPGLIGEDNAARLLVGFSIDIVRETIRKITHPSPDMPQNSILEPLRIIKENPTQAIREVLAIADSDIREMLTFAKEHGIGISVIHAVDDGFFPMERVQKVIDPAQIDGFYSVRGTHQVFTLEPVKYTKLAETALSDLEKKHGAT